MFIEYRSSRRCIRLAHTFLHYCRVRTYVPAATRTGLAVRYPAVIDKPVNLPLCNLLPVMPLLTVVTLAHFSIRQEERAYYWLHLARSYQVTILIASETRLYCTICKCTHTVHTHLPFITARIRGSRAWNSSSFILSASSILFIRARSTPITRRRGIICTRLATRGVRPPRILRGHFLLHLCYQIILKRL